MADPAYAFTIPSLFDLLALHCRIYHPGNLGADLETPGLRLKGAIVAHPFAPLGGSYDDQVVLSVIESLVQQGYVVGTFNFRGADGSEGRSSWSGRGEIEDYASFLGLVVHYLSRLKSFDDIDEVPHLTTVNNTTSRDSSPPTTTRAERSIQLLLGGYSFGSLVLARLPPVSSILKRFETAEKGSACSEIFLRARTLAKHTRQNFFEERPLSRRQVRQSISGQPSPSISPRLRASSVTVGGEEANSANLRHSRDSRKSVDVVREIPHRIRTHIRRHSSGTQRSINEKPNNPSNAQATGHESPPDISIKYLMISPVLIPFTTTLAPPGLPISWPRTAHDLSNRDGPELDLLSLRFPTLAVFGSFDTFTSSKKLQQWAEKLGKDSPQDLFEWTMVEKAGHFWREQGAMRALKTRILSWVSKID